MNNHQNPNEFEVCTFTAIVEGESAVINVLSESCQYSAFLTAAGWQEVEVGTWEISKDGQSHRFRDANDADTIIEVAASAVLAWRLKEPK